VDARQQFQPGRLWSLWDMMEKYGFFFAQAIVQLSEAKWLCVPIQLQPGENPISREMIERAAVAGIQSTRRACILSDMDNVLPELDRLTQLIWPPYAGIPPAPLAGIAQAINHLISRLQDELKAQWFFHLTQSDVQYFGKKMLFGLPVVEKFKGAAQDIEDAGNCIALQQPTACVFHLMRAMEVAVRTLGKRLKITITPQTTWRQMTGQMDDKIKKMPEATDKQKNKKNDWEAARANLHHVGSVWRNKTMHPAASYSRSQALDVFNATRVFMSGLCEL
jgi:hypothetical protein